MIPMRILVFATDPLTMSGLTMVNVPMAAAPVVVINFRRVNDSVLGLFSLDFICIELKFRHYNITIKYLKLVIF
jgi:hypothetical protein